MRPWIFSVCCLALWFLASPVQAGSVPNMNPGLWEITSEVKMPGMTMPAATTTQCITRDSMVPQGGSSQGQGQCDVKDVQVRGDTVSWMIECHGQGGAMTGTGEITYHGDRFEGSSKMTMQGMEITTEMQGKRIGACQ
mgnify:CR=1 FL=1